MRRHLIHHYQVNTAWTGNAGTGTSGPKACSGNHALLVEGKPPLPGSADPAFPGGAGRSTPEELLIAALSACHMLWYLHLAAREHVIVQAYTDRASGTLVTPPGGAGYFSEVTLRPTVSVPAATRLAQVHALHRRARALCSVARPVRFPVHCEPAIELVRGDPAPAAAYAGDATEQAAAHSEGEPA
ncbi:OsmC family protein [Aquisalimonas lutea]|uniref:OsmC family protein n=1 Tax=Aquisalimonas lutea TaxID=1327750 RepID=UPI0025B2E84D|nr:OsmC family protein [Aquisalimonas lutea]MDN3519553.1 OsmC family protein [Aquisalimonas lutea]